MMKQVCAAVVFYSTLLMKTVVTGNGQRLLLPGPHIPWPVKYSTSTSSPMERTNVKDVIVSRPYEQVLLYKINEYPNKNTMHFIFLKT